MKTKNLILGGGFTGMFLATQLFDAVVIDRLPTPGGLLKGFKTEAGFTYDIGGHVYTTENETVNRLFSHASTRAFTERKAYYDYEKKVPFPLQYHANELGVTARQTGNRESYCNLKDFLLGEFGAELYFNHLEPFNRRVWSTDPEEMDFDWVDGRIALLEEQAAKWGMNSSFQYAPGEEVIAHLLSLMTRRHNRFLGDERIISVDIGEKVVVTTKNHYQYETLYDTIGITHLNHFDFKRNEVTTIGVGLNKELDLDFHWWYNGANESPIHRITLLSRYHHSMAPFGSDSLLVEIPHSQLASHVHGIRVAKTGDIGAEFVARLLHDAHFTFVNAKDIDDIAVIQSPGYPIPFVGHRERAAKARAFYESFNVYLLGRWGAHGYYNLQHIVKDVFETMFVVAGKDPTDYYWANYYYKTQIREGDGRDNRS